MWVPVALVLAVSAAADPRPPLLERRFRELAAGYEACFVLYDARQDRTLRVGDAECRRRLSPCSTFKVFNSLAGLQSGVVQHESTLFATRIVGVDRNSPRGQGPDGLHAREISRAMLGALPR